MEIVSMVGSHHYPNLPRVQWCW